MPGKVFSRPLEIQTGNHRLKFSSSDDIDFCLSGRTAILPEKISQFLLMTSGQLEEESSAIRKTETQLFSALSDAIDNPDGVDRILREIDTLRFTQDHDWREIIKALNEGGADLNPLRQLAMAKYLQYLSSLLETIGYIRAAKERNFETASGDSKALLDDFRETALPENVMPANTAKTRSGEKVDRLVKGEPVTVKLVDGVRFDVALANCCCELSLSGGRVQFADQKGRKTVLDKGKYLVGRSSTCNIKLGPEMKEVSRVHLLIHNQGDGLLLLTDLSSHGTSLLKRPLAG